MKNIIKRNAKAIFDLAQHNGVDVGVGRDMFASNLSLYDELGVIHPGADVDYKTLSAEWDAMTKEERAEALQEYADLIRDHYHDLGNAYAQKDFDKFEAIVNA